MQKPPPSFSSSLLPPLPPHLIVQSHDPCLKTYHTWKINVICLVLLSDVRAFFRRMKKLISKMRMKARRWIECSIVFCCALRWSWFKERENTHQDMLDVVEIEMDKDKRWLCAHDDFDDGDTSKCFNVVLRLNVVSEKRVKISFNTPHQPIIIKTQDFRTAWTWNCCVQQ